jgi:hypothetical protein
VARASLAARPATITAPSTSRPAAELFATAYHNRGLGSVRDFKYDSSNIVPIQAVGVDSRVSNSLILNGTGSYNDLKDSEPYLCDSTGRRVGVIVGLNWVF